MQIRRGGWTLRFLFCRLHWNRISARLPTLMDGPTVIVPKAAIAQIQDYGMSVLKVKKFPSGQYARFKPTNTPSPEDIYRSYPGIRQVPDESPLIPGIEVLVEANAGVSSVYNCIQENSNHRVSMDEPCDEDAKARQVLGVKRSAFTNNLMIICCLYIFDDDAVAELIVDFNLVSSLNVSSLHESARGDTGVSYRERTYACHDKFREVVQMDCTHQTNQLVHALTKFNVSEQYSLIVTNSDWRMVKCMYDFKRPNEHWRFVRIIIVDKDMREIEVIRKKFPEVIAFLSHLHAIKWLHETIRKSKTYEVYEEDVLTQMKHCITNMTYASVEGDYIMHRNEFNSLACRDDRTTRWQYFNTNWNKCREMWVIAFRVESLFEKLKGYLKGHFTMHASLKVLLDYQRPKEEEYKSTVEIPGTLKSVAYCEEMNVALSMTTRWVDAVLKSQYDVTTDSLVATSSAFKKNGSTVTVQHANDEYLLEKTRYSLSEDVCKSLHHPLFVDFVTMVRANSELEGRRFRSPSTFCCQDSQSGSSLNRLAQTRQQAFARISGELTQLNDADFESAMTQLDQWLYNLRNAPEAIAEEYRSPDNSNDGGGGAGGGSSADAETKDNDHDDDAQHDDNLPHENSDEETPAQPSSTSTQGAGNSDHTPNVILTGNIWSVGRPRLNRAKQKEKARTALKEYNQGMKLRASLRECDICEVKSTVEALRPSIRGLGSYIATFQILAKRQGKSIQWRVDDEHVTDRIQYRPLESVVNDAFEKLMGGFAQGEPIDDGGTVNGQVQCRGREVDKYMLLLSKKWDLFEGAIEGNEMDMEPTIHV
ncbi:LOW QUALITY PROTEIN: hypothetical protein PHMEG_0001748 [Phytophthora megakarya]|uniref:ZSWIM1/3 RNaseH-like domain-containing protein n=1 Tax=Phytophthora megakarya TaxID=4795 RepID=A0A225X2A3_9STRA|nr:LOW QUALITY PROTEIN: hypothetical protein PHMEG_0001748 [Phytophthora megakarya]